MTRADESEPDTSAGRGAGDTAWADADADRLARLRTALAAERTVFAVIRTGLAIAGGGAVIVTIIGGRWPDWLQAVLALGFVVPGYILMLDGLGRYRRVARLGRSEDPDHHRMVSPWVMALLIGVVQVVVLVVVLLLLVDAFEA